MEQYNNAFQPTNALERSPVPVPRHTRNNFRQGRSNLVEPLTQHTRRRQNANTTSYNMVDMEEECALEQDGAKGLSSSGEEDELYAEEPINRQNQININNLNPMGLDCRDDCRFNLRHNMNTNVDQNIQIKIPTAFQRMSLQSRTIKEICNKVFNKLNLKIETNDKYLKIIK